MRFAISAIDERLTLGPNVEGNNRVSLAMPKAFFGHYHVDAVGIPAIDRNFIASLIKNACVIIEEVGRKTLPFSFYVNMTVV